MYIILHLVRDKSLDEAIVLVQYVSETGFLQECTLIDFLLLWRNVVSLFQNIKFLEGYSSYNKLPFLILRKIRAEIIPFNQ